MSKIITFITLVTLLIFSVDANSQMPLKYMKYIESEINTMLDKDSENWGLTKYQFNSVYIIDPEGPFDPERPNITTMAGIFNCYLFSGWSYEINPSLGGEYKKIVNFTAEVKRVLDYIAIVKIYWTQPSSGKYMCIGYCD